MISIPSAPRALHPSLGSAIAAPGPGVPHTVTGPVSPATLLSAQTLSKTADAESSYPDTTKSGSSNKSSNSGVASHGPSSSSTGPGVDSKRPKIRRSTSHSSRNVHLTEEITPREMALAIIQAQYHIYHSDLSGYLAGGAMVQDALTKYALGGSSKDLFQTFKRFKPDKERIPPAASIQINSRNWKEWLGHKSYYHEYLDFFHQELLQLDTLARKGESKATGSSLPLTESWAEMPAAPLASCMTKRVSDYLAVLIPGLCGSTGPLIHLGYGIEFGSRLVTAEGLAYACISYQSATACYIPSGEALTWARESDISPSPGQQREPKKGSPRSVAILSMIRNDKRLDGNFDAGFQSRLNVVMSSRISLLKSYLGIWTSQVHSVSEALQDLSQTCGLLLFTATNRAGDEQQLDKNLADVLLAIHAARFLMEILSTAEEKEQLIKAIWMSLVATYVVQGRPKISVPAAVFGRPHSIHVEPQETPTTSSADDALTETLTAVAGMASASNSTISTWESGIPGQSVGRWRSLCHSAIHAERRVVPKIVRALWLAEMGHGACGDLFYDAALRALGEDETSDESSGPGN